MKIKYESSSEPFNELLGGIAVIIVVAIVASIAYVILT